MKRAPNPPLRAVRIVAVHLLGSPARAGRENAEKIRLVGEVAAAVEAAGWPALDAVVFPGGLFWMPTHVGPLEHHVRRRVIERAPFSSVMARAAGLLAVRSPAVLLVGGILTPPTTVGTGDQLAVAWRPHGVAAIGRKVWPSPAEAVDPTALFLVDRADFASRHRLLRLASGHAAVLCACYDMFGVAEVPGRSTVRTSAIRLMLDGDGLAYAGEAGFPARRAGAVAAWQRLLRDAAVTVALATVHGFERPGGEVYWQRHGVAAASAALGGGLAVAAAHFRDRLPAAFSGMLAASGVPHSHLGAGLHRWAWPLEPAAAIEGASWSARLFTHDADAERISR